MTDGNNILQDVPVDWEALEDAFENNAPEVHSYLHIQTGEVLRVVDGIADPEMHSRISTDAHYMRIDPVSSREQYRWMERFIPMVTDEEFQTRLTTAIDGKGAFRRFKDVLMSATEERERWFAFRSERLRVFMEAWMGAHGLAPIARPLTETQPEISETDDDVPAITQEQLGTKHHKPSDLQSKQLLEIVEGMSSRDFEKVLTFAEFVKARTAARAFSVRTGAALGEQKEDTPDDGTAASSVPSTESLEAPVSEHH